MYLLVLLRYVEFVVAAFVVVFVNDCIGFVLVVIWDGWLVSWLVVYGCWVWLF